MLSDKIRANSNLGELLRRELAHGEQATVLTPAHKGGAEVDARLVERGSDGQIQVIEHVHLNSDLTPKR